MGNKNSNDYAIITPDYVYTYINSFSKINQYDKKSAIEWLNDLSNQRPDLKDNINEIIKYIDRENAKFYRSYYLHDKDKAIIEFCFCYCYKGRDKYKDYTKSLTFKYFTT